MSSRPRGIAWRGQEEALIACLNPKKDAVQITHSVLGPREPEKLNGKQWTQQKEEGGTCAGTAQSWAWHEGCKLRKKKEDLEGVSRTGPQGRQTRRLEEGRAEEMPHSRHCALLFLGNPCSRVVLCSGHTKKRGGFGEQPSEPAPAMTLPRDGECGSTSMQIPCCSASSLPAS